MVAAAMMNAARVSLLSPSASCVREPASSLAPSNSCASPGCSGVPSTSVAALSSRATLSGACKFSHLLRRGRSEGVRMQHAAMGATSAAVTSTVDLNARRPEVETAIDEALNNCIAETHFNDTIPALGPKIRGKVSNLLIHFLFVSLANHLIPPSIWKRCLSYSQAFQRIAVTHSFCGAYFPICVFVRNLRLHCLCGR